MNFMNVKYDISMYVHIYFDVNNLKHFMKLYQ